MKQAIQKRWPQSHADSPKVKRYVGQFWDRQRRERKITAVVQGNHGDYTVAIEAQEAGIWSACSCYIGKRRYCHHCAALGLTFLAEPDSFVVIEKVAKTAVTDEILSKVVDRGLNKGSVLVNINNISMILRRHIRQDFGLTVGKRNASLNQSHQVG